VYLRPLFEDDDLALVEVDDLGLSLLATSSLLGAGRLMAGLLVPVGLSSLCATWGRLCDSDLLLDLLLTGLLSLSATLRLLLPDFAVLPDLLLVVTFALLLLLRVPDDPAPWDRLHLLVSSLVALAARPALRSPSAAQSETYRPLLSKGYS
jgi:hypothetical protein